MSAVSHSTRSIAAGAAAAMVVATTVYLFREDIKHIFRSLQYDRATCKDLKIMDRIALAIRSLEFSVASIQQKLLTAKKEGLISSDDRKLIIELNVDSDYIFDKLDALQVAAHIRPARKLLIERLKASSEVIDQLVIENVKDDDIVAAGRQ